MKQAAVSSISVETEIYRRMEELFAACESGNVDRVMSFYAPDVVVFDCPPKLRLRGREEYRQSFDKWFASSFQFPVKYTRREEKILASGDLAVVHGLVNVKGKFLESGEEASAWLRHTVTFQKISGEWLITHEHFSAPIDQDLKALMELDPDHDRAI